MLYLRLNFGGEAMHQGVLLEMRDVTVSTRPAGGSITCGPCLLKGGKDGKDNCVDRHSRPGPGSKHTRLGP